MSGLELLFSDLIIEVFPPNYILEIYLFINLL